MWHEMSKRQLENHLTTIEQKKCFVEVVSAEVPADEDDWLNEAFSIACDGAGFDSVFYVSADGERGYKQ